MLGRLPSLGTLLPRGQGMETRRRQRAMAMAVEGRDVREDVVGHSYRYGQVGL